MNFTPEKRPSLYCVKLWKQEEIFWRSILFAVHNSSHAMLYHFQSPCEAPKVDNPTWPIAFQDFQNTWTDTQRYSRRTEYITVWWTCSQDS